MMKDRMTIWQDVTGQYVQSRKLLSFSCDAKLLLKQLTVYLGTLGPI